MGVNESLYIRDSRNNKGDLGGQCGFCSFNFHPILKIENQNQFPCIFDSFPF